MTHIPLSIPRHHESQALGLGAIVEQGQWSLPLTVDPFPFHRWLRGGQVNIRAREYWLAKTLFHCLVCQEATPVITFVLPPGHQVLEPVPGSKAAVWNMQHHYALLSQIRYLIPTVFDPCHDEFEWYQPRILTPLKCVRYVNLCSYCQTDIIDMDLFDEPGVGFLVTDSVDSKRIELSHRSLSFMAEAGAWTLDCPWLEACVKAIGS